MAALSTAEKSTEARRLRESGLVWREIGERLGISLSHAQRLATDPAGERRRNRRRARSSRPTRCGRCNGPLAQAPKGVRVYCDECVAANHRERNRARWQVSRIANNERQRIRNSRPDRAQRKRDTERMRYIKQGAPTDPADIRILFYDPCSYCGAPTNLGIDHITPIIAGGGGDWDNLTGCCLPCNIAKRERPLLHFLARRLELHG